MFKANRGREYRLDQKLENINQSYGSGCTLICFRVRLRFHRFRFQIFYVWLFPIFQVVQNFFYVLLLQLMEVLNLIKASKLFKMLIFATILY